MTEKDKSPKASAGLRVLTGMLSVPILAMLPVPIIAALQGEHSMWLIAFTILLVGIELAVVALSGNHLLMQSRLSVDLFATRPKHSPRPYRHDWIGRIAGMLGLILMTPLLTALLVILATMHVTPLLLADEFLTRRNVIVHVFRLKTTGYYSPEFLALGRFMRKCGWDELPLFLNLARGDIGLHDMFKILRKQP